MPVWMRGLVAGLDADLRAGPDASLDAGLHASQDAGFRWENLDRRQYPFQPIKFVNLAVPSPRETEPYNKTNIKLNFSFFYIFLVTKWREIQNFETLYLLIG